MLRGTGEEREGALLRRIKGAGQASKTGGFGFVTGAESGAKRRAMTIVARIDGVERVGDDVRRLIAAGVDGIEVAARTPEDIRALAEALADADIPYGVYVAVSEGSHLEDVASLTGVAGLDWIHVTTEAPARLLADKTGKDADGKGKTRLVGVSPDMPPGRLAGVAGLKADLVVVDRPAATGPFTVDTLLALRTIQGATRGPVLAGTSLGILPDDIQVLHDNDVAGVLVTGGPAAAEAFIEAIEKL